MLRVAVIEDQKEDASRIQRYLIEFGACHDQKFQVSWFLDADSFLNKYRPVYDLIFMDIELPGQNGMDAARRLREVDSEVTLIFTTNLSSYAVHGYEVNALDYMLKPITYPMFQMKMLKAVRYIEKNLEACIKLVLKGQKVVSIPISSLYYIEVSGHYLIYHTETASYEVRGALREVEEKLLPYHFLRCNNCYLVNLRHIRSVQDNTVVAGTDTLPISRPKKKSFLDGLTKYLGGTYGIFGR